jgi:glycerate dehydrogenase
MKIVVLNGEKVNFDGIIDYRVIGGALDEVVVHDTCTKDDYPVYAQGAQILVSKELPMPGEVIRALPASVKLICEAGTGYNNIDIHACRERSIGVCNVPAYSSDRVAHTAAMLMLNLSSSMQVQLRMLATGDRSNFTERLMVRHTELNGKALGVIGAGNIGQKMIKIGLALDMHVLVYNRTKKDLPCGAEQVSFDEVLWQSDYLSLHCPLTDATRHMINADTIAKMKPTACIINTSRGALIDESELIRALLDGRIAGAGLDVQETEPPLQDNVLYTLPNVILTPHMGWKGLETRQRLVGILKEGIDGFRQGLRINRVD